MKIVVTGGAGFIGSHIVDAYIALGHEVHVIDDLSTGQRSNINSQATLHELDILDPEAAQLIRNLKPEYLSHHAAQMDVRRSVADPTYDARVNIIGFIALLEAAKEAGVKKVIFASSGGAVYGDREPIPASESHETVPMSPYGVSKLTGEHYLAYYSMAFGLPYIALRYANVYGPRQSSKGEAGVVAIFLSRLLAGEAPVINGDGSQTRDYVYVGDVVRANVAATTSPHIGVVNIGTGIETDVLTICRILRAAVHSSVVPEHAAAKVGEQLRSCLDANLAFKLFDWQAEMPLEQGLKETAQFYQTPKH